VDANDWKQADDASRRGPFFTGALKRRDGGPAGVAGGAAHLARAPCAHGQGGARDNIFGMAAQLSYYFLFSLFPALLLLMAIASCFPVQTLVNDIFTALGGFAPPEAISIITHQIKKITEAKPGGLLTVGVAAAIWSSSSAMSAVINTLNNAYDIEEGRPWWKVQLTAISLRRNRARVSPRQEARRENARAKACHRSGGDASLGRESADAP